MLVQPRLTASGIRIERGHRRRPAAGQGRSQRARDGAAEPREQRRRRDAHRRRLARRRVRGGRWTSDRVADSGAGIPADCCRASSSRGSRRKAARSRHRPGPQHHPRRDRSAWAGRSPRRRVRETARPSRSSCRPIAEAPLEGHQMSTLLIVDDDARDVRFMAELLAAPGRRIADDAGAGPRDGARPRARAGRRDLGHQSERRADRHRRAARDSITASHAARVVLISGFGTLETAIDAVRHGAFDYISKPFNIAEVKATVERALRCAGAPADARGPAVSAAARPHRPHVGDAGGLQADRARGGRRRRRC